MGNNLDNDDEYEVKLLSMTEVFCEGQELEPIVASHESFFSKPSTD